jgi:DeoR/GlpR family transcriptional regulator of sugar metabolism
MLSERHNRILQMMNGDNQISVKDMAASLNVSSVTIRQDLNFLESEGLLKRVHGGAVIGEADDISNRMSINYENKLRIAHKIADMIKDGETILIESGSTNALLARELVRKDVTIITTNVFIARQFRKKGKASVVLMGGLYQHESESLVGKITKLCIDQVNFDKAFIGIDGYTKKAGFTLRDLLRAEISAHIIRRSSEVYIVSDSSKFGRAELTNICQACDIHHIVTDVALDESYVREFQDAGIDLVLA